jgi:outer membrane protein OmpA-like peptidoglycan-associated protein
MNSVFKNMRMCIALLVCAVGMMSAQQPAEESVPIEFELAKAGRVEMMSVQRGRDVYLPLGAVFSFLKVRNDFAVSEGKFSGRFIDTAYVLNTITGEARVGKRQTTLSPQDYLVRDNELYLRVEQFQNIFGLPVKYNPRLLAASLRTNLRLPVFQEQRLAQLERNLARRTRPVPEWDYQRRFTLLDGFRLDYTLRQTVLSQRTPTRSFATRLGFFVLGGDADLRLVGDASSTVRIDETTARWRFVPDHATAIRQIQLGHLPTTGTQFHQILGGEITNRPAHRRMFFAIEPVEAQVLPDRKVYMYRDGRLADVQSTPTGGAYMFEVPLRFGASYVDFRTYNEWGELFEDSYRINIPATMLPPGEVEYSILGGKVRDGLRQWFGESFVHWGINDRVTIGAGTQYDEKEGVLRKALIPSADAVVRVTDQLVGDAFWSPNAYLRGALSMTLPSLVSASVIQTKYHRNSRQFNPRRIIDQTDISLTIPMPLDGGRLVLDGIAQQTVLEVQRERIVRGGLGVLVGIFNPRIGTRQAFSYTPSGDFLQSTGWQTEASLRVRMPGNLLFTTAGRYDHRRHSVQEFRADALVHPAQRFTVDIFYTRRYITDQAFIGVNLQYVFPFIRIASGFTRSPQSDRYAQLVSGSLGYSLWRGDAFFDYSAVRAGYGSVFVAPYVDENNNGRRDRNESLINRARIRVSTVYGEGMSLAQYPTAGWGTLRSLPYQQYIVEVDKSAFENPLWVPRYEAFTVTSEPGRFLYIDLPIAPGGMVRGSVNQRLSQTELRPLPGLKVSMRSIPSEDGGERSTQKERETVTFSNGEFEFIGILPGRYEVVLDKEQVTLLDLVPPATGQTITIQNLPEGDVVEGVDFVLAGKAAPEGNMVMEKEPPPPVKTVEKAPVPAPKTLIPEKRVVLRGVTFHIGQSELTPESIPNLEDVYRALRDNPKIEIEISGHTDSTGSYQFNLDLSLARANSVKAYLVSRGIDPDRIRTIGVGPDRPIAPNETVAGRALNRRIEFMRTK